MHGEIKSDPSYAYVAGVPRVVYAKGLCRVPWGLDSGLLARPNRDVREGHFVNPPLTPLSPTSGGFIRGGGVSPTYPPPLSPGRGGECPRPSPPRGEGVPDNPPPTYPSFFNILDHPRPSWALVCLRWSMRRVPSGIIELHIWLPISQYFSATLCPPPDAHVVCLLPVTLDTPMNRPGASFRLFVSVAVD